MMFNKWKKYSYADQKSYTARIRITILKLGTVVLFYLMLTNFFLTMIVMESSAMQPSIMPGDRFVFFAFNLKEIFVALPAFDAAPYKRGDIVTINPNIGNERAFLNVADKLIQFFTAGKKSLSSKESSLFVKRIIGLPGDEISMVNFVMHIHPAGNPHSFTEYELQNSGFYKIDIPQIPAIWDESLPFSGSMRKIQLGEDEYFVLSDDRSNTNDSRTWGAVPFRSITGKALFRYWPLTRIDFP